MSKKNSIFAAELYTLSNVKIMCRIKICNIGSISKVEMTLKKVTFILGPQSSGKSTIAKLLCHCQWVEKRCYNNFEKESQYFMSENNFIDGLVEYHRLEGYFREDSYIKYEGNYITLEYENGEVKITKIDKVYTYPKVCYIPAERNLITAIPNLKKYNDTNDLILYFMYDWFEAREYLKDIDLSKLLQRPIAYHYIKKNDSDEIKDGETSLKLANASSGVQSILPLCAVMHYVLSGVYERYKPLSYEQLTQLKDLSSNLESINAQLEQLSAAKKEDSPEADVLLHSPIVRQIMDGSTRDMLESLKRKFFYKNTNLYVEEPEQNLFPEAQETLLYWMLKNIQHEEHENSLLITTHSPYILFALNNCLLGGLLREKVSPDNLQSRDGWISPDDVAVYEIHKGELKSIQDEDGLLDNNFLNRAYKKISKEYLSLLIYYGK